MGWVHVVSVDDQGAVEIPVDVLDRSRLGPGAPLILIDDPQGLVLLTLDQLRDRVRAELAGVDLVSDLLVERRRASQIEHD